MNEIEARVRCLEIAERIAQRESNLKPAHIVALAEPLQGFVLGDNRSNPLAKPDKKTKATP